MQNQYQQGEFGPPEWPQEPPPQPPKGRRRTVIGICVLTAVAVAAAVTAVVVVRQKDEGPPPVSDPSKPLVAGWKTVVNPEHGTAFDVPPDWEVLAPSVFSGHTDRKDPDKLLIGHTAPAFYKSKWCSIDADGDGRITDVKLGAAGTKGAEGAKDTAEIAEKNAPTWVYAAYAQPDKSLVTWDKPVEYHTKSGVEGTYVKARSAGVKQTNRCAGDGQAIVFGFKNSKGGFVAWNFYGRTGVPGAVGDDLVMRILSTVRLSGDPKERTPLP
ncbi:hypothetical protein J7E99_10135 [Streptomyces sp. ISL-44]|uniref:hypothetical protein n=1 Tax=Streptomyces sp. ISL-44 TaxID=2819184 RepID=UPI001BE95911|nr:hypothetical protein [Streptomyces sp. ISL-44]MBT2541055.1 hypothetical protein [Streptomyces sp. ISL-44]